MNYSFNTLLFLATMSIGLVTEVYAQRNDSVTVESRASDLSTTEKLGIGVLQVSAATLVHAGLYFGVFGMREVFNETREPSILHGIALLASLTAAGTTSHLMGNYLHARSDTYLAGTLGGALLGIRPWGLLPESSKDWRMLNHSLPPAILATLAYGLQLLILDRDSKVSILPYSGRGDGLGVSINY